VNSGRNQDLGREGLATAEKPGTKSQKLGPRALGDGGCGCAGSAFKETSCDRDLLAATTALVCSAICSQL
jgi:hypothetical protein